MGVLEKGSEFVAKQDQLLVQQDAVVGGGLPPATALTVARFEEEMQRIVQWGKAQRHVSIAEPPVTAQYFASVRNGPPRPPKVLTTFAPLGSLGRPLNFPPPMVPMQVTSVEEALAPKTNLVSDMMRSTSLEDFLCAKDDPIYANIDEAHLQRKASKKLAASSPALAQPWLRSGKGRIMTEC